MKKADHQLVQQVLDGDLPREQFDRFQQRLRREPELAELYGGYAMLHHTLAEKFEGAEALGGLPEVSAGRSWRIPALVVAAVLAGLAALVWWTKPWTRWAGRTEMAVLTFSVDAVWQIDGALRNTGGAAAVAPGSRLSLLQGRAAISLEPTVKAVIEGPAELAFPTKGTLHLERGRGYFERDGTNGKLTVTTPRLKARDAAARFGIETQVQPSAAESADELRVLAGKLNVTARTGGDSRQLVAGDGIRISNHGKIVGITPDGRPFPTGLGRFHAVLDGPFDPGKWRVRFGNPAITPARIDGANYAVHFPLPEALPTGSCGVMLVTIDIGQSTEGPLHSDGWAGISFFSEGREVLFFGDSFGAKATWSLDVKQRVPVIMPPQAVTGPRLVTLRYSAHDGGVSLHDGAPPLKPPFCAGRLPAGTRFDELRLGASAGAALAVNALQIRACAE